MTNCSDDAPTTSVFYDDISEDGVVIGFLVTACLLALVCLLLFVEEVFFIRKHYKNHDTRGWKIILLLGLYPTVCITSLIAVLVPTSATLVDLLSSCYVSICIYTFINMTIECFGGKDKMVEHLADDKVRLSTPPCCCCLCCILKPIKLTRKSLRVIELFSMQVMFIRPALLFISAILWTDGQYNEEFAAREPYVYIAILSGISVLVSMYGLIVIFRASRKHLTHYHLALKFIPLQLVIVLVNLQKLIFNALANNDIPGCKGTRGSRVRATNINNGLLVIEVFLCCLIARKGYRTLTPNQDEVLENIPAGVAENGRGNVGVNAVSELRTQISVTSDNVPIYQDSMNTNEYGAYNNTPSRT